MTSRAHRSIRSTPPAAASPVSRPPLQVRLFGPVLKALVRAGIPLGYNRLVTVRGRTSGEPRSVAVAVIPIKGSRWVWAPWGEVNWVRNLRAAGRATVTDHGREQVLAATELNHAQRIAFFTDVLLPFIRRIPFGVTFIRLVDGVDLRDPVDAAGRTRVFELRPDRPTPIPV